MVTVQQDTGANEICRLGFLGSARIYESPYHYHWIYLEGLEPRPQLFPATLGLELMAKSQRQFLGSHL